MNNNKNIPKCSIEEQIKIKFECIQNEMEKIRNNPDPSLIITKTERIIIIIATQQTQFP